MEGLAAWFATTLGKYVSAEVVIFIVSMIPILECRGGLIVASLLQVPVARAVPICIIGNILPIPFILIWIRKIFAWMKKYKGPKKIVDKLEKRAMSKSDSIANGEFIGLLLFVGIPLPGTGAWTGSLIASLMEMDIKKASIAIFLGILMATVIVATLSYGLLSYV